MATAVCRGLQPHHEAPWLKLSQPNPCFFDSPGLARVPCLPENPSIGLLINPVHQTPANPLYKEFSQYSVHEAPASDAFTQKTSITARLDDTEHVAAEQTYQKAPKHDLGGWSFLQALSTTSQGVEKESIYAPPMAKRSLSSLSNKSLELCTENLGSETGSETSKGSIFSVHLPEFEGGEAPAMEKEEPKLLHRLDSRKVHRKVDNSPNFPPPLTTMSSSGSIHLRSHREKGRLVIEAVDAPSTRSYFQAERSHGRLRLSILRDFSTANSDPEEIEEENGTEEVEIEVNDEENEGFDEEEDEEEAGEAEEEGSGDFQESWEDIDGNGLEFGAVTGKEKFRRPRRCKEGRCGNESLCNWEPLWVATSS